MVPNQIFFPQWKIKHLRIFSSTTVVLDNTKRFTEEVTNLLCDYNTVYYWMKLDTSLFESLQEGHSVRTVQLAPDLRKSWPHTPLWWPLTLPVFHFILIWYGRMDYVGKVCPPLQLVHCGLARFHRVLGMGLVL